ncbi:MAG: glycosyltransferase family A protein [Chloroflexota bacterium]
MPSDTQPLVSFVMGVFNGEAYLPQALGSIFQQTYENFECIVVNDGSTDNTLAILNGFQDPRLRVIDNEQNVGLTRSLNIGLAQARGGLIARHDADDLSHPNRLERQVAVLNANPGCILVGSSYEVIDTNGTILDTVEMSLTDTALQNELAQWNCYCHGSVLMRQDVLRKVCGYRESFPVTQDYDLWLRMAEQGKLLAIAEPCYQYRIDPKAISQSKLHLQLVYDNLARKLSEERRTVGQESEIPADVLAAYPPTPEQLITRIRRTVYLYYLSGKQTHASEALQEADFFYKKHMASAPEGTVDSWGDWMLSEAKHLLSMEGHSHVDGERFIRWVDSHLPNSDEKSSLSKILGDFYAELAFLNHQNDAGKYLWPYSLRAIAHDASWIRNRGLWKITVQSSLNRLWA